MKPWCAADAVQPGRAVIVRLTETRSVILLRRHDGSLAAYRNACPHMGVELDWEPRRLLSRSGRYLRCSGHGALFRPEDGVCISGPCSGEALTAVPLHVDQGMVVLDA
jgi:nitrite reductase/ring-hydroxylating ferredoxin subunit